jgi:predicted metal-dependent phosphotriesterase family hydrolase
MIAAGFGDRLLLGMDVTRERLPAYGGRYGYAYLARSYIPFLLERGISSEAVRQFMVDNPRRALALRAVNA